jgi:hypothetical protein
LKRSKKLQRILQIILVAGNYLNGRTFRGAAYGFRLESLKMLHKTFTNASDSPQTLLHYIARRLQQLDPELISFYEEMPALDQAQYFNILSITSSVRDMDLEFKNMCKEVSVMREIGCAEGDYFLKVFEQFHHQLEIEVPKLLDQCEQLQKDLSSLFEYFGEDKTLLDSDPHAIFDIVKNFNRELQVGNF